MNDSPGMWEAIIAALRNFGQRGSVDERGATAQQAAGQIAQQMPGVVMPHDALEKQRQREALIDAMMRGAQ